ncbi:MAG: TrmB family transcriptional regulator [Lachnospiraceae bacterium]
MEITHVIDKMMTFGLTRQEAIIYICLCEHGEITGYEVSKYTGISKSNIYASLTSLTEKGAAYIVEGTATKYVPIMLKEFLDNKMRAFEKDCTYLLEHMPKIKNTYSGYITIVGSSNIKNKIRAMITQCDMRLYLLAQGNIIEDFREELEKAIARDVKITIISDTDFSEISYKNYYAKQTQGQIRLIIDSTYVLSGEITDRSSDTCLFSKEEHLVTIFKEALRNKIRLIELE